MQSSVTIDLANPDAPTRESVAGILASVSDRFRTQLQVTKTGIASISSQHVSGGGC